MNLGRLLHCTERMVEGDPAAFAAEHYVAKLKDLLSEAITSSEDSNLDDIEGYRERIRRLEESLCQAPSQDSFIDPTGGRSNARVDLDAHEISRNGQLGGSVEPDNGAAVDPCLEGAGADGASTPPRQSQHHRAGPEVTFSSRRRVGLLADDRGAPGDARDGLQRHLRVQDAILADTSDLVSRLKAVSLQSQQALGADRDALSRADRVIGQNAEAVAKEARRIKALRMTVRASCFKLLVTYIAVTMAFLATIALILTTRPA